MIDLVRLRKSPQEVITLLQDKDPSCNARLLYDLDEQVRRLQADVEVLRHEKNELAKQGQRGVTQELRERSKEVGSTLKQKEQELETIYTSFQDLYLSCPNVPDADLPKGGKEANKVTKEWGQKPSFNFPLKNHVELGTALGWLDFEAAAVMAGNNFALYKGEAVKLMYALTMFLLKNNMAHGYEPILPPVLLNEKSLEIASNFPKFRDQVFKVTDDKLYLTPTAEVNLTNLYRDHIFTAAALPIRMTSWTSCFRREAGAYGSAERGLIRMHQFEKVELYTLCEPSMSGQEQERMLACAETILQKLDLPYRVVLLAMQDCSFASARTYDLEVWLPEQKAYKEIASISNCADFQARRGKIRYKKTQESASEFVHTLNGSSLALSRLMVALFENYQQADGSIIIPEILKTEGIY